MDIFFIIILVFLGVLFSIKSLANRNKRIEKLSIVLAVVLSISTIIWFGIGTVHIVEETNILRENLETAIDSDYDIYINAEKVEYPRALDIEKYIKASCKIRFNDEYKEVYIN